MVNGQAYWGWAISISGLCIAFSGPFLGNLADKKNLNSIILKTSTYLCILFTAALWFAKPSSEYILFTSSGNYSAIWRPYHYIGLELAQSVYSIALDNRATGYTKNYNADVASFAKKDLKVGEKLDGEGGFCARGRLITSEKSKKEMILPLGLTDNAILKRDISKDDVIRLDDVELNLPAEVIEARKYQYNLLR